MAQQHQNNESTQDHVFQVPADSAEVFCKRCFQSFFSNNLVPCDQYQESVARKKQNTKASML